METNEKTQKPIGRTDKLKLGMNNPKCRRRKVIICERKEGRSHRILRESERKQRRHG